MKATLIKSLLLFGAGTHALSGVLDCTTDAFQSILDSNGTVAQVVYAQHYDANSTFQNPNATTLQFGSNPVALPATCAVQINVTTEYQTHFSFGIFLPDDWNGRFFLAAQEGTNINWVDMAVGLRYGFASVATDTGHTGSDMTGFWYLNPESLNDWGWRANHLGTVYGKLMTEQFYGTDIVYSYMAGCSTGGRQSFKEAQMFPEDFDGIVSACPAYWTTHQQLFNLKQTTFQYPPGSNHTIPTELFDVIGQEVIRQCDPQDGLVDGLVSDPLGCNFDYHPLLCIGSSNSGSCLTGPQLDTLHKFYSDWKGDNDTFVYAHSLYGSEAMWNQSGIFGDGSLENIETQYWYPQHILGLTNFTFENLTLELVQWAEEVDPGQDQASDWDLSPFYERGGKLLHYHGHSDAIVPPGVGIYFRDQVAATIAPKGIDLDEFYRLFLIPGMEHCYSTPENMEAPWYFAGPTQASFLSPSLHSVPGYSDAEHDIILALMRWVENGTAPEFVIGTHFAETVDYTVDKQRPICAYPNQAKYNGTGDIWDAANFVCAPLY